MDVDNPVFQLGQLMEEVIRLPGASGVAIATGDGLVVGHRMKSGVEPQRVAAMAAAMLSLSKNVAAELRGGTFIRAMVEMSGSKLIVLSTGDRGAMAVLILPEANLGLLFLRLEGIAENVGTLLGTLAGSHRIGMR